MDPVDARRAEQEARSPLDGEAWRWAWCRGRSWCVVPTAPVRFHPLAPIDDWGALARTLCGRGCWAKAEPGVETDRWWRDTLAGQRIDPLAADVCRECWTVASWCGLFAGYVSPLDSTPPIADRLPVGPGPRAFSIAIEAVTDAEGNAAIALEGPPSPGWSDPRWGVGQAAALDDPPHLFPASAELSTYPPGRGGGMSRPSLCGRQVHAQTYLPPVWDVCAVCRILAAGVWPPSVDSVMSVGGDA